MALQSPPPYFPQGIQEPNAARYRKFKLIVGSIIAAVILLIIAVCIGAVYLIKHFVS